MTKLGLSIAAAMITLASVVACSRSDPGTSSSSSSSSGDTGTTTSSSSSSGSAVTGSAFAEALCAHNDKCDPASNIENFGNTASCVTGQDKAIAVAKSAPDTGATDAALSACAAAIQAADCNTTVLDLDACIFKGTRAAGTACATREQCATGICIFANNSDCGTCGAGGAVGAACGSAPCAAGLGCDSNTETCTALPATGGDCSTLPCGSRDDRCILAKCVTGAAKGAACTAANDTSDDSCGEGLECANAVCATTAVTAQAGQTCGNAVECINGICVDSKCVANLAEGAACDDEASDDGPFCSGNLECLSGKCAYPPTLATCN